MSCLGSIVLSFILLGVAMTPSCGTGNLTPQEVADRVEIKAYAGDSASHGISRAQEKKTIRCDDPEIDDYICLSYEDLKKIFNQLKRLQQKCNAMTE